MSTRPSNARPVQPAPPLVFELPTDWPPVEWPLSPVPEASEFECCGRWLPWPSEGQPTVCPECRDSFVLEVGP